MLQCGQLSKISSLGEVRYEAGTDHLKNLIRWPFLIETSRVMDWIKGGELLILPPGTVNRWEFSLPELIRAAGQRGLAGVLVLHNPGENASTDEASRAIADEAGVPLITAAALTPPADLMEELCRTLVGSVKGRDRGDDVIRRLLQDDRLSYSSLTEECRALGYDLQAPQRCVCIRYYNGTPGQREDVAALYDREKEQRLEHLLRSVLRSREIPHLFSPRRNRMHVLLETKHLDERALRRLIQDFALQISTAYPHLLYNIGVSGEEQAMWNLQRAIRRAEDCIFVLNRQNKMGCIRFYEDLGLYSLLLELGDSDIIRAYYSRTLGRLVEYDELNHTDFVTTLQVYMEENCNITRTADRLFLHRNTLKYRLKRIEEVTGCSLEDSSARINLQFALMIHTMMI